MGCDIHIIAEVKKNGKWEVNKKEVFPNIYYDKNSDVDYQVKPYQPVPDDGRNYDWFSVLADVRNGGNFETISDPKGEPDDASEECISYFKEKEDYSHSHSYLTLQELLDYDWDQKTSKSGIISLEDYCHLRENLEYPNFWHGDIWGANIKIVDFETANIILDEDPDLIVSHCELQKPASELQIFVEYHWPITYRDWFKNKFQSTIEPLKLLAKEYEDVRIVFCFDN